MLATRESLFMAALQRRELPSLPAVLREILKTTDDEASSTDELSAIIEKDPPLVVRILRVANSPFYGARYEVDSIRRAIVTIGFEAVRHLALATTVLDVLSAQRQVVFYSDEFWMHSFGAARAAQLLALKQGALQAETCFTAGLLHDLGKYVLALILREQYSALVAEAAASDQPLHVLEQQHFELTHAELGGWLVGRWGLPQPIQWSIRWQLEPLEYNGPYKKEVHTVAAASDIAREAGYGCAGDTNVTALSAADLERLELPPAQVHEVLDELRGLRQHCASLLALLRARL